MTPESVLDLQITASDIAPIWTVTAAPSQRRPLALTSEGESVALGPDETARLAA
ncbi:MAG: hypothetical protein ACRDK2_13235 [Solirubrobacteraceae bacterium]